MWTYGTQILSRLTGHRGGCMFSDYGFTHITLKDLIEYTVHEVLLLKQFLTICVMSRHVIWIQDFITTVGCGSHQMIHFECFKILLILEDGVLGDFSFDALFEVHKMLSTGIWFWFRWSSVSRWRCVTLLSLQLLSLQVMKSFHVI